MSANGELMRRWLRVEANGDWYCLSTPGDKPYGTAVGYSADMSERVTVRIPEDFIEITNENEAPAVAAARIIAERAQVVTENER